MTILYLLGILVSWVFKPKSTATPTSPSAS